MCQIKRRYVFCGGCEKACIVEDMFYCLHNVHCALCTRIAHYANALHIMYAHCALCTLIAYYEQALRIMHMHNVLWTRILPIRVAYNVFYIHIYMCSKCFYWQWSAIEILSTELAEVALWFDSNKLTLNVNKTQMIMLSRKNILTPQNEVILRN